MPSVQAPRQGLKGTDATESGSPEGFTGESYSTMRARLVQAPEQELELPEDMALDGEAGADEAQEDARDQDAPGAEADAPERFPEQPLAGADRDEGVDGQPADQDADVAGPQEPEEGVHASEQQDILEASCVLQTLKNCKGCAPGRLMVQSIRPLR